MYGTKNEELGFKRPFEIPTFIGEYKIQESLCDDLIDFFESQSDRHTDGIMGGKVDKRKKDSTDVALHQGDPIFREYLEALSPPFSKYIEEYGFANYYDAWGSGVISLQKYNPKQGFYAWHSERTRGDQPYASRHLVFMTYLNDVTDGGETEFFYQRMKFQPRKGLTLIWPADWTFTHRGCVSENQTKYIATGWMNYIS